MTCCTGVEQMFMRLLLCWKQQGSGEKVRQIFRNLLERSLAVTQYNASALRPSTFFFVRQPHLLCWKDCNWLIWNLSILEGYQSFSGNIIRSHSVTHFLVEAAFTAGEWRQNHTVPVQVTATEPRHAWSRITICEYLCIFIYSSCIFYVLVCVLRCTHTHSVFTLNSLFINSLGYKSWCSLCSVLSTAVPRRSVNKLAGSKRAGCLLVGHRYKLLAVNERV